MPKSHVLPTQYKIVTKFMLVTMALIFTLISCTTFEPQQNSNYSQLSANKQPSEIQPAAIASDEPVTKPVIDKTMDNWAKARAVYLRSLDYATIDQQDNPHGKYYVKSSLVETRYHIKDSADALYIEHNLRKALQELRAAVRQYNQAFAAAPAKERDKLTHTKADLQSLLKMEEEMSHYCCKYPQHEAYKTVDSEIEALLTEL